MDRLPHQISKLHRERKVVQEGMACDASLIGIPQELTQADKVDYPSDEDSDDEIDFEIEIPPLADLLNQFEKDDIVIARLEKDLHMKTEEAKVKGFKLSETDTVVDEREAKMKLLTSNMQKTRSEWASTLPTLIQDLNSKIKDP